MFYSAHVLVLYRNAVLLVKRRDIPIWVIPGGWAEEGEKPNETATRELFEETGIRILSKNLHLAASYAPANNGARAKYTHTVRVQQKPQFTTTNESSEVGFFPLSHLPEPISVYETKRISDAVHHQTGETLESIDHVSPLQEFLKFMRTPGLFLKLLFSAIQSKTR